MLSGFEVKLLNPVSLDDRDPGFFPVARVDQHTRCHVMFSWQSGRNPLRAQPCQFA